jgi:hypothetical protein
VGSGSARRYDIALAAVTIAIVVPGEARADGFGPLLDLVGLVFWTAAIPVAVGVFLAAALRRLSFLMVGLGGGIVAFFATPFGWALADKYNARSEPLFVALFLVPGLVVGIAVLGIAALMMRSSERADRTGGADPSAGPRL